MQSLLSSAFRTAIITWGSTDLNLSVIVFYLGPSPPSGGSVDPWCSEPGQSREARELSPRDVTSPHPPKVRLVRAVRGAIPISPTSDTQQHRARIFGGPIAYENR
eukprot:1196036-Prorocentrum_minimum.AAC.2